MSGYDDFPRALEKVTELISKLMLVESVVHAQQNGNRQLVEGLVHRQNLTRLQDYLKPLHSADIASLLEALPIEERQLVWLSIDNQKAADILMYLAEPVRDNLIQETSDERMLELLKHLDLDDVSIIAGSLSGEILQSHRALVDSDDWQLLHSSMSYPEESVGRLMSRDVVVVRSDTRLKAARRYLRRMKQLPGGTNQVFVTDERGLLCGALTLEMLLMGDPMQLVRDIMAVKVVKFHDSEQITSAARAFERYDLLSAPVVNARQKLVGRLTIDDMVDVIRQDAQEDTLNIAGVKQQEDLFSPIWQSVKNRWPWLALNLLTVFIASRVIGLFEQTIAQLVALAVLMPIVGAMAGNTGNQTTALVIRGLALNEINPKNQWHLMRKELGISLLNGIVWGAVVGLFTYLLYHNLALAAVINASVILNLLLAACAGVGLPLLLKAIGRDPAMGASILITATTDSLGFFIFLGLATLLLI